MISKAALAEYEAQLNQQHQQGWYRVPWPLPSHMPVLNMPGLAIDMRLLVGRGRHYAELQALASQGGLTLDEVVERIGYKFKRRLATECLNIIKAKAIERGIL